MRHEDPTNSIEQHKQPETTNSQPLHALNLQVGAAEWKSITDKPPVNDGFSINFNDTTMPVGDQLRHTADGKPVPSGQIENNMKHTADGIPTPSGQAEDSLKHTADGKPPVEGNMAHMTEVNGKDKDVPGSAAWLAQEKRDYIASLFQKQPELPPNVKGTIDDPNSQAWHDHVKKGLIDNPYGAPIVSPEAAAAAAAAQAHKEHSGLPNKFVHDWKRSPTDILLNTPVDSKPIQIGPHQPNEDTSGGKSKTHSWF